MRRTAAWMALGVAVVEIATFVVAEVRLRGALAGFGASVGPLWTRLPTAAAFWAPWLVGGILLLLGRRYLGTVVVVPAAVLSLPRSVLSLQWYLGPDAGGADGALAGTAWIELAISVLLLLLLLAAGVLAWRARPRTAWRHGGPTRRNLYTVAAFLAWLPSILSSTQFLTDGPPGTSRNARRFVEFLWTVSGGWGALPGIAGAALLGAALLVAPRLRRDAAGTMVLLIALPLLVQQVGTLVALVGEPFVIPTPAGWLGTVGAALLVVLGAWWLRDGLADPSLRATRRGGDGPGDARAGTDAGDQ